MVVAYGGGVLGIGFAVIADDVDGQCDAYECKANGDACINGRWAVVAWQASIIYDDGTCLRCVIGVDAGGGVAVWQDSIICVVGMCLP